MATIVCIDDQAAGLVVRKAFLESKGYTVLTATGGARGVQVVQTSHPDAVVLDWQMPGMDGEQVAKILKAKYPTLPILLLSGWPKIPATLRATVDGFIQKGAPIPALLSSLRALLKRPVPETMTEPSARRLSRKAQVLDGSRKPVEQSRRRLRGSEQLLQHARRNYPV